MNTWAVPCDGDFTLSHKKLARYGYLEYLLTEKETKAENMGKLTHGSWLGDSSKSNPVFKTLTWSAGLLLQKGTSQNTVLKPLTLRSPTHFCQPLGLCVALCTDFWESREKAERQRRAGRF